MQPARGPDVATIERRSRTFATPILGRLAHETESDAAPVGGGDHLVEAGEGLASIAEANGHFWQYLWDHPDNAALKQARGHAEILLPGDKLTVPPIRPRTQAAAVGQLHRFRRKGVPARLRVVTRDAEGRALASKAYELRTDTDVIHGTTGPDGEVDEFVAPQTREVTLVVTVDEPGQPHTITWNIRMGQVEPAATEEGIAARLENLGYAAPQGAPGHDIAELTTAIERFQHDADLDVTGEIDDATSDALVEQHGG